MRSAPGRAHRAAGDFTPVATPRPKPGRAPAVEPEVEAAPELGTASARPAACSPRLRGRKIDDETWDELEEALLLADVGIPDTERILDGVQERAKDERTGRRRRARWRCSTTRWSRCSTTATSRARSRTPPASRTCGCSSASTASGRPRRSASSRSSASTTATRVVLAAADTFRAAAADQLQIWAERTGGEHRARAGGRRSRLGRVRRDGRGRQPRRRSRARRHRGPAAHEVQPHGGAEEAAPHRRPHARARSRRCCS